MNWDPELFIENSVGNLKQDIKHRVEKREDKTIIVEMRTIKGIFWERLELGDFPLGQKKFSLSYLSICESFYETLKLKIHILIFRNNIGCGVYALELSRTDD